MELRRLGDPLLRSQASPLLSFLAPSVPQSWWSIAALGAAGRFQINSPRHPRSGFHTTAHQCAEIPSNTADLDFLEEPSKTSPTTQTGPSFSQRINSNPVIADLLDKTLESLPNPAKPKVSDRPANTSFEITKRAYDNMSSRDRGARIPGSISGTMNLPPMPATSNPSQDVVADVNRPSQWARRAKRTIRSRPSIGRTIEVNQEKGGDFGRALRSLEILCNVNRVRQDLMRQRFHERPGLKKKRLKSERWRKLFRDSFRATVGRVQEMRRKGW